MNNKKNKKNFIVSDLLTKKGYQYLILSGFIMILYIKTIGYDYNLDDYIIMDSLDGKVNSLKDLAALFKLSYNNTDYRPIVFLSIGIERLLFGIFSPAISHAINCILYFLVCMSGLKLFSLIFDEENNPIIFLAVLLFCVHPINTEVVASIKCRDNLLSMLFGLICSILFLLYLNKQKLYLLIFSVLSAIVGLLSKFDAIGFVLLNLVYVIIYNRTKKINNLILYLFSTIAILIITNSITDFFITTQKTYSGKTTFTENPLNSNFTFSNSIIAFLNTVYYYITKLTYISPSKYYYGYNYLNVLSVNTISFIGGITIFTAIIILFIYAIIKQKKTLVISITGMVTLSAYALNLLIPVAGIIADRYIFMASLFFCLFSVYLLDKTTTLIHLKKYSRHIIIGFILFFSVLSFIRVGAWKNFRTLIETDAPHLYNSYEAMRIASSEYFDEYKKTEDIKDLDQAIFYAEKGNSVYPKNTLLHLLLGQFYFKKSAYKDAIQNFKTVIMNDSTLTEPLVYLGDTYYATKNLDSALAYYNAALKKFPKNATLINNISTVYFEKGDKEKCLQFNYDLIKKDSTIYAAYENLGYFYLAERDTTKAKSYFKEGKKHGLKSVNIYDLK